MNDIHSHITVLPSVTVTVCYPEYYSKCFVGNTYVCVCVYTYIPTRTYMVYGRSQFARVSYD